MTQGRIISVKPVDSYFSLTWQLGTRCNYDCMYCPTRWHDDHSQHHSLETLQEAWQRVLTGTQHQNLPYKISFTGGELTTSRSFLPFVTWLRENHGDHIFALLVTTNGSASQAYYQRMFDSVDNITFSVHSEHINETKFFDMILGLHRTLPQGRHLHVNIMDEPWNRDRIPSYQRLLCEAGVSHSIQAIDMTLATRDQPRMQGRLDLAV
jgi:molybdenum cofactor biosynthesis enzyme MoaA